ncbi:MAG: excalibur calcium-binding domain-containing protein [Brevundimonas sp.]|nr:MAG: excalibur calcium-binding domain-containing protein [Brevundimonas sp.]
MIRRRNLALALAGAVLATPLAVAAHPGGLNSEGCHNNRKTGDYHCHRGPGERPGRGAAAPRPLRGSATGGAFANCAAARAAGAAPVRRGDPGYGAHLDRDGDGVGCE